MIVVRDLNIRLPFRNSPVKRGRSFPTLPFGLHNQKNQKHFARQCSLFRDKNVSVERKAGYRTVTA
jgi:hypothetical protein